MGIAKRIKQIRGEEQQDIVAVRLGIHKNTLGRWERGERIPDQENLLKILQLYPEINPAWLVTGEGPMRRDDGSECGHPLHQILKSPPTKDIDLELYLDVYNTVHAELDARKYRLNKDKESTVCLLVYRDAFWNGKKVRENIAHSLIDAALFDPEELHLKDGDERKVWDTHDLDQDEYALVPRYNVEVSAGGGALVDGEAVIGTMAFKREWLRRMGLELAKLAIVTAQGDSMLPTFADGDVLLVDLRQTEIVDGAVHVLRNDGHLLAKRLQLGLGDQVIVRSDNTIYRELETTRDRLKVVGRVIWRGGRM